MNEVLDSLRRIRGDLAEISDGLHMWPTVGSVDTRLRLVADNMSLLAGIVERLAREMGAKDDGDGVSIAD